METICTNITVNLSQLKYYKKKIFAQEQRTRYLKFNNKLEIFFPLFKDLA